MTKKPKITTIIFDVGGVQYFYDHMRAARSISKIIGVSSKKIYGVLGRGGSKSGFSRMVELGPSEKEYWGQFSKELGIGRVDPKQMSSLWNKIFWPNKPMLQLIKKLGKKYKIGILSNMSRGHKKFLLSQGISLPFKKGYVLWSCDTKIRKPDRRIYNLSLKCLNIKPEEALFVDDFSRNIKAAKKLGIKGVVYKNHKKFLKELKKVGVEI